MSTASPHQATERVSYELVPTPTKRSSGSAWAAAAVLLAASGGLGYYAFTLQSERDGAQGTLEVSQRELTKLRADKIAVEEKVRVLEQQGTDQEQLALQQKSKLNELNAELAVAHTRLDELHAERGEINEQLAEFRQMTRELQRMIDTGRLQVTFRRGRMIVELPAQVLFPSGSADLTADGKEALDQVAKSLRGFKSRHFIVAGHTDNVPVSGHFTSNWELSSARAVNVTEALVRGGLRPEQLVAAGYGEYDPVARNTNEAGKQKNRRIEIILEPRLRELPEAKPAAKPAKSK